MIRSIQMIKTGSSVGRKIPAGGLSSSDLAWVRCEHFVGPTRLPR